MMFSDENKKSFGKMMKGRALYLALGVCVLAAGIVGIRASNSVKTPEATTSIPTTLVQQKREVNFHEDIPAITEAATNDLQEITEPTTANAEPATQEVFENSGNENESPTEGQAPEKYTLPLSGVTGMDYSMGIPVFSSTMSDYRTHNGVDFVGEYGEGVKAIAPGKVIAVYKDNVWGNTVEIDHGGSIVSKTAGLQDEGLIGVGSEVYEESVIGVVGNLPVEAAEGAHIHLEIKVNGALNDPLAVMGYAENTAE